MRFRSKVQTSAQVDSLTIYEGSNVFIDHCSFSYANDENIGIAGSQGTFEGPLTISNSILSHPLYGTSGKGILIGGPVDEFSFIRNAFIHCATRHPQIGGGAVTPYTKAEIVNNLIYKPYYEGTAIGKGNAPEINFIGNVLKPGQNTQNQANRRTGIITGDISPSAKLYVMDNLCPARSDSDEWSAMMNDSSYPASQLAVSTPFDYGTPALAASDLESYLSDSAGAFYWNRDAVDAEAISDMNNSTGAQIGGLSEAQYPSIPELHHDLNVPTDPHGDDNNNGYTNLEEWVQTFVP